MSDPLPPRRFGRRAALAAALAAPVMAPARADQFPSRAFRLIVGVAAGASLDTLARGLARGLNEQFGVGAVVENQASGGGLTATLQVARAPADGHTLLIASDSLILSEALLPEPGYSSDRSFAPVTQAIRAAQILVTHPRSGIRSVQDYVDRVRAAPGTLNLGLPVWGGIAHVGSEILNRQLGGLQVEYVPYRGGALTTIDLLAGQLDAMIIILPAITEHVRQGRIVPLAVTTAQRDPTMPEVPTLAETVAPGYELDSWQGVLAPAGTPPTVIAQLHAAIAASLAAGPVRDRLVDLGFEIVAALPAEFARRLSDQARTLNAAVREAGIRPERS
ncbi:tripartite tricarboxylate transporter substrate-binding protein [Paracraurococcus lichenis]|uniref:Tripartite tricarboxylate transporter substrate-binding protein n=1 Tax=Paracraurococcus lichenis TaxID=3064888 RepID=A0ABT9E5N6_9PROT|nr:tripartite tricarboxylate transporter substrate-binding protein [Paracraurococcus sp. LOR1-02]MDO9711490.1 tripartite tricarboxylate transporter substrate-binding protein [Paracraurococcus sp. LOR1-02]